MIYQQSKNRSVFLQPDKGHQQNNLELTKIILNGETLNALPLRLETIKLEWRLQSEQRE